MNISSAVLSCLYAYWCIYN